MAHILRFLPAFLLLAVRLCAQPDTASIQQILRHHIDKLADPGMMGRGYVADGREMAADYIDSVFSALKMHPEGRKRSFRQAYTFPVNTFPGDMYLQIGDRTLEPGKDYLTDAASASFKCNNSKVVRLDAARYRSFSGLVGAVKGASTKVVYILDRTDSFCKSAGIRQSTLVAALPKGCFIIPEQNKKTWTVLGRQVAATVFYVDTALLSGNIAQASVKVEGTFVKKYRSENLIASVPGTTTPDSFIVFSAHYDHLGKMGNNTVFPGASDNASGTAMLLYMAQYYAAHPQKYTMVFIAFSGEEVGLLGSAYFVQNPAIPLEKIRFLINTDIMGDATDGITVVNATEYPGEFEVLKDINEQQHYLPVIKQRGKAANSDHYYFSEEGVPAIFIYSNGGKGFYHDIYDVAGEVTLTHVPGVARLLTDFVEQLQGLK
jgi:aminopeptidase YwaD